MTEHLEHLRMVEALLFAAAEPLDEESIVQRLPGHPEAGPLLVELQEMYARRGVNLVRRAGKWMFQTAPDLAFLLQQEVQEERRLSRAAQETLAIIAYHQPVTRAEIEEIRGVTVSKGTVDLLMEVGWVRIMGRRQTPGKPVTYGVSEQFLIEFGLESSKDLPGIDELKAAGLLDAEPPENFRLLPVDEAEEDTEEDVPLPFDDPVEADRA
ncbi:MAG: SMC-Scp complex subunit ScpB [Sphingomonadales bacterium]